ncbi:MAG: ribbon-helix-helix domain-containing protein [Acidipropionibacterium acidipropionici]|jgi:Arc/MetJ-type ribon-helix-helix transcriptional regulator|uniref:Antitoxin n=2 Tax=Acidipropionibacterium acidipropionici TaxID=1748 RepID=A0A142KHP8_9ACTN|nr:ribbon-helix-helix domain-containing protein [Acidipropionibacterium acidipropionici]AFV91063.1 Antitoxin MazE9 [Acidipropionibacterium acidipropionici ATCC 4875]ALN14854.1 antitoxin [Acidipropionibacterium acidipropionici]AMS05636.1 antitoxin [Acidipropionibacterium acidipropionici]AOZ47105.1 antitoxin [Acidipropionibacterium acidipropionici]APZ09393.1 antitoxin [Acidipropionibacterium acidipropionici]
MKLSVSLSKEQVETIDRYIRATGMRSRSAVIQKAIGMLGAPELEGDYAAAWDEWESGDAEAWESTAADGLGDDPR